MSEQDIPSELRPDGRQTAAATQRNRDPILDVLKRVLPDKGTVLEIGSGTGEHAVYFAANLPHLQWLPSEPAPDKRVSIVAWIARDPSPNLRPPQGIDVRERVWSVELMPPRPPVTAIVSINMLHIAPWECCLGLMQGAGRILQRDHILYLYGPFMRDGEHTAPSNAAFDARLREENPDWGLRDIDDVKSAAKLQGLTLDEIIDMPANNFSLVFRRT